MSTSVLAIQIAYNYSALKANLEGVSQADSLRRPEPAGNCLNWVVGHILTNRDQILELVGQAPVFKTEAAEVYKRGSQPPTDPARATELEELGALMAASQDAIKAGLASRKREDLEAPGPGKGGRSVEEILALLVFHEAYHVGQTGLLRRLSGRQGAIR